MDSSTMAWVLTGLVSTLGAIVLILIQRQLTRSDEEAVRRNAAIDQNLKERIESEARLKEQLNDLQLQMSNKIGREELKAEIKSIYDKLDGLGATIMAALSHGSGKG